MQSDNARKDAELQRTRDETAELRTELRALRHEFSLIRGDMQPHAVPVSQAPPPVDNYSLLSVSLPASSTLYTRRGTLLGLNGPTATTTSTLSLLSPLSRAPFGIPFLYRKLTSTAPLTALISTNTPNTTFCVLSLDGTADWALTQPTALLAWSGHSIVVRAREITGRGLVALAGRGQVYQVALKEGEEFAVRQESLLAYSAAGRRPVAERLGWAGWALQVPAWVRDPWSVRERVAGLEWVKAVTGSSVWAWLRRMRWTAKTAVYGDRQFLRFVGPATVLLQSRTGGRLRDLVSREEMRECAEGEMRLPVASRKTVVETVKQAEKAVEKEAVQTPARVSHSGTLKKVTVRDGKVEFEDSDFKEFTRK